MPLLSVAGSFTLWDAAGRRCPGRCPGRCRGGCRGAYGHRSHNGSRLLSRRVSDVAGACGVPKLEEPGNLGHTAPPTFQDERRLSFFQRSLFFLFRHLLLLKLAFLPVLLLLLLLLFATKKNNPPRPLRIHPSGHTDLSLLRETIKSQLAGLSYVHTLGPFVSWCVDLEHWYRRSTLTCSRVQNIEHRIG